MYHLEPPHVWSEVRDQEMNRHSEAWRRVLRRCNEQGVGHKSCNSREIHQRSHHENGNHGIVLRTRALREWYRAHHFLVVGASPTIEQQHAGRHHRDVQPDQYRSHRVTQILDSKHWESLQNPMQMKRRKKPERKDNDKDNRKQQSCRVRCCQCLLDRTRRPKYADIEKQKSNQGALAHRRGQIDQFCKSFRPLETHGPNYSQRLHVRQSHSDGCGETHLIDIMILLSPSMIEAPMKRSCGY
mmetsp:Transcript_3856/g.7874  ORF Transcript_3856/g.7874 Transcript_3856/m.7874 type:complete len:242 (-) Transcript_3856:8-733(-)